jgi:casein kinase II subunit beta
MSSSSQVAETWISQFCSLLGHEYFAEVSEDFIEDDFNLTGLPASVPMYKEALELILDVEPEDDEEEEPESEEMSDDDEVLGDDGRSYRRNTRHMRMASDASVIESSAELLYGLIHQRYITSRPGIQQMLEKYELQHFGHCPRVTCNGSKVLPVGLSDVPGQDTVKLFCPGCMDIYTPPNSRFQTVDGAFFGTTFGCLFFMTFPDLEIGIPRPETPAVALGAPTSDASRAPSVSSHIRTGSKTLAAEQPESINGTTTANFAPGLGLGNIYEPRIYGFRVSERSRTGPRMKWLREKPGDINELDEATRFEEDQHGNAGDQMDGEDAEGSALDAGTGKGKARRKSSRLQVNGTAAPSGGNPMDVENDGG